MNPAKNCPGRALPCCDGCQRLVELPRTLPPNMSEFLVFRPTIRGRAGKPRSYCVDRWPPADEIAREIEEMPL